MALKVRLARPKRSSWPIISFLISFTFTFLLVFWVVWAAAHAWNGSLISTFLITLGIATPIALFANARNLRDATKTTEAHSPTPPQSVAPAPIKMTFGNFMGSSMLFIWECVVFGFLVFCFDGIFSYWAQPPFHHDAPIDTHVGLDLIITLVITSTYFTLRQRAKRMKKAEEAAAAIAAEEDRARSVQERKDKRSRDLEAYEQASYELEQRIEKQRASRAREIEELEQELASYKNIPGELEESDVAQD